MRSVVFVCLLLATLTCVSGAQTILPSSTIINWTDLWLNSLFADFWVKNGAFCYRTDGGIVYGRTDDGSYTVFTNGNGLPGARSVLRLAADSLGLLWVKFDLRYDDPRPELQVFDGIEWREVGEGESFHLLPDGNYGVWAWLGESLKHYGLKPPSEGEYDSRDYGLERWPFRSGIDSDGHLWGIGPAPYDEDGPNRIYSFDGQNLTSYQPPGGLEPERVLRVDSRDRKWFGVADERIGRLDGDAWSIWGVEDGLPEGVGWTEIAFDENARPYFLGEEDVVTDPSFEVLVHFDGVFWQEVQLPGGADVWLASIASDEAGTLYGLCEAPIYSRSLYRLGGDAWEKVTEITSPVTGREVSNVAADKEDGVWFYSYSCYTGRSSITHMGSQGFTIFDDYSEDGFHVIKVDSDNNKWFGGSALLVTKDMQDVFYAPSSRYIWDIAFAADGTAYVACTGRLYRITADKVSFDDMSWVCNGAIWDVEVGPDGKTVWLALGTDFSPYSGARGAIVYDDGSGWRELGLPYNYNEYKGVISLEIDRDERVWALLYDNFFYSTNGVWLFDDPGWHRLTARGGVELYPRYPITLDSQENLWFYGTIAMPSGEWYYLVTRGLFRFDGQDCTAWTQMDGILPSISDQGVTPDSVGAISEDQYGNMWLAGEGVSVLLAEESLEVDPSLGGATGPEQDPQYQPGSRLLASTALQYLAPSTSVDLYVAIQVPSGQLFYVAAREAAPPFPIFYAAFEGSTEFLEPGPDYTGPGSIPNTPDMKDLAAPALPLPDPPDGNGPTGLALFAYPVPYFANVPLPAYGSIDDLVLLNTTLPEQAPAGAYTFHIGLTGPFSIKNVYRSASCPFEVKDD